MTETGKASYLARLDEAQQEAVKSLQSTVVTAGAGAGKTTVLASRFVHLVLDRQLPLRSILALTFTRKASAEMYERIYSVLAAETSPRAAEQLADYQNAHITTLDSFCTEILRQTARDFGYTPEFTVDESRCEDMALAIAYRYILSNRNKAGLKELLASFSLDDAAAYLFKDLGMAIVSPEALQKPLFSIMAQSLENLAAEKASEGLGRLADLGAQILELAREIPEPRKDCQSAIDAAQRFALAWEMLLEQGTSLYFSGEPAQISALKSLQVPLLGFASLGLRAYSKGETETEVKKRASASRDEAKTLLSLLAYEALFPSHCALLDRLDEYARILAEAKRKANILDFKDLGLCAVASLIRRKDIRAYWKNRISSIMIDEFQDNNKIQRDLLYLLAEKLEKTSESVPEPADLEEGKLFFVGDEKQSIYRFRGADVRVFKRLALEMNTAAADRDNETPADEGRSLRLPYNYRSTGELLAFFNNFFSNILEKPRAPESSADLGLEGFEAEFLDMKAPSKDSTDPALPHSSLRYFQLDSPDENDEDEETTALGIENDDDRLAFEIADFIKSSRAVLEVRSVNGKDGGTRLCEYEDFAILLRTTTQQQKLEKYLRLLGIPYDTENLRGLYNESPANDIYSILQYAINPGDIAAYAAVLRCPLARFSQATFMELITNPKEAFSIPNPSARDAALLERARAFFAELRGTMDRMPNADLVEFIWHKAGLRLDILSRPDAHAFLEHFDYLFHLAAQTDRDGQALSVFLAKIGPAIRGEKAGPELEQVPRRNRGGVKILTIHKAKGLQFPIVIIPWVDNAGRTGRNQKLWQALPEGIALDIKAFDDPKAKARNVLYELGKAREEAMEIAEIKRLLYVACTRAEDHLCFFGKKRKQQDSKGKSFQFYLERQLALQDSISNENKSAYGFLESVNLPRRPILKTEAKKTRPESSTLEQFRTAYQNLQQMEKPYPRRRLSVSEINKAARDLPIPSIDASPKDAKPGPEQDRFEANRGVPDQHSEIPPEAFGTLCHSLLDHGIRQGSLDAYSPPLGLAHDFGTVALESAMREAAILAENFFLSPFWSDLKGKTLRMRSETAFIHSLGHFIVEGRMDLLAETEEESIVIDFKTDEVQVADTYMVQLDIYRRAAFELSGRKKARACLYWLKSGQIQWLENPMSEEALLSLAKKAALSSETDEETSREVLETQGPEPAILDLDR